MLRFIKDPFRGPNGRSIPDAKARARSAALAGGRVRRIHRPLTLPVALGAGLLALSGTLVGATGAGAASEPSGVVDLVAYSTPAPAYTVLVRDFQKTPAGKNVLVESSFGASGTQSKNVVAGQPADVVNFSLATDMERLVAAGLVSTTWGSSPVNHGYVTNSVVAFAVPKGNPEHIKTWADLLKAGIRIFTPNPFSSGSARWNIMAAYGAQLAEGHSPAQAQAFLKAFLAGTVVQDASAADELQTFLIDRQSNKTDVLIDYESDILQAINAGAKISYVVPRQTILIQNPIAVTTDSKNPSAAAAFVTYLESPAGQNEWARLGYRPVLKSVATKWATKFPAPKDLFTIQSYGLDGWDNVAKVFFSTSKSSPGIVTQLEGSLGISTSSG